MTSERYERIKIHIESLGYTVIPANHDAWDSTTQTIYSNTKRKEVNKIIHLLHELGHIYLFRKANYSSKFRSLLDVRLTTSKFKVSEIEQEVLAWEEAEKLANRFGVEINEDFYKCKFESLKTYIIQ